MSNYDFKLRLKPILTLLIKPGYFRSVKPRGEVIFACSN